jgi:hypothetical protein
MSLDDRSTAPIGFIGAATALVMGANACNLVDDQPTDPIDHTGTDGGAGEAACLEAAVEVQSQCVSPLQFVAVWDEGNSTMILADDPAAAVGVGPNGWLVKIVSSADYVGTYQFDGGNCTIGCGWCQPGQSLCYTGLDENGVPDCMLCIEGWVPDPGAQCALHVAACPDGLDDTGGGEGLDETGADGDLDETGAGLLDDGEEPAHYDCSHWDPVGAVTRDPRGSRIVDAAIVEEIAAHYGDPLADCDGTSFKQQPDGYFAVATIATNGLLAQLGLLPGDAILAIDGVPMNDIDILASTAVELFMGSRVTSGFTLAVGRGRERFAWSIQVR